MRIFITSLSFAAALLIAAGLSTSTTQAQKKEPYTMKLGDPLPANAFVELAKLANPAVVNIATSTLPQGFRGPRGYRDPYYDMLEQFFGMRVNPQQMQPSQALGTGFFIREDGLIVTNNHVIDGADVIKIQINEKSDKLIEAKVIGRDSRTDIALLKVEGKGYPVLQLGSSSSTEVGEWVAAFGNPFGKGHTMTKGIISAKGRDISEINRFPLLQTDAPINPGNSGGPLVNMKGQVIGVNSAIDPRAQGIGFAIPIDEVKAILPQLEKEGRIRSSYLGVALADLDPRIANELGLKNLSGAVIAQVDAGSPAAKGGLSPYDVVTEWNGKKIEDAASLTRAVADTDVGTKASVTVIREGKTKTLSLTTGERPQGRVAKRLEIPEYHGSKAPHNLGFQVSDMNPQLRKDFEIPEDIDRPVIVSLEKGSAGAQSGLLPGDIILDVNRREVKSASEVLKNIKRGTNTLRVYRQGAVLFLMLRTE